MEEKKKYDPMTGEEIGISKRDTGILLVVGILFALIVPALGMIAGLIALYKRKYPEGAIILFVSVVAWILWSSYYML